MSYNIYRGSTHKPTDVVLTCHRIEKARRSGGGKRPTTEERQWRKREWVVSWPGWWYIQLQWGVSAYRHITQQIGPKIPPDLVACFSDLSKTVSGWCEKYSYLVLDAFVSTLTDHRQSLQEENPKRPELAHTHAARDPVLHLLERNTRHFRIEFGSGHSFTQ